MQALIHDKETLLLVGGFCKIDLKSKLIKRRAFGKGSRTM